MRVWTVSEVKAGTLTQCLGIAHFFDEAPHKVVVQKKYPIWARGPLSLYRRIEKPEPDMIISCGSMSPKHVFAIREACSHRPFTVYLQRPHDKVGELYDMVFVSRHDWRDSMNSQPNFHQMLGVPHQITTAEIEALRPAARKRWVPERRSAVTVLIGGPNDAYAYDDATVDRLVGSINDLAAQERTVLVSTSRRSRPDVLQRLLAQKQEGVVVWDRTGDNPYREFLAAADALVVTKDTITMVCEALMTGRPVFIFDLAKKDTPKLQKFEWFHADMRSTLGLTRPFEGDLAPYSYVIPDETTRIARLVAQTTAAHRER